MTSANQRTKLDRRGIDGFTLVEVVIVIAILGMIAAVVAAAFVVVARSSPAAEARADDARSLLGLTNWLSQDVASTSELGFEAGDTDGDPLVDSAPTLCQAGSVPPSQGLLQLTWNSFVSNYRWVPEGDGTGAIYRFTCTTGGAAQALRVTANLNEAPTTSSLALAPAPVRINLLPTQSGNAGNGGIEFLLYVIADDGSQRELLRLDATTRNVRTTLPPLPPGGGSGSGVNRPPNAAPVAILAEAGADVTFAPMPINDPDNDQLFIEIDSSGVPASWHPALEFVADATACAPLTECWRLEFSVDNGALVSDPPYVISYKVCDRDPALDDPDEICTAWTNATVTIVSPPDGPPTAEPFQIDVEAGLPVTDFRLPVNDENPSTLSIDFKNPKPNGWNPTAVWTTVAGVPGWYLSFPTDIADVAGPNQLEYKVTDAGGQENQAGWVTITVNVTPAPVDNPPVAGPVSMTVAAGSIGAIDLPVTDESVATLSIETRGAPSGWNPAIDSAAHLTFQTSGSNVGAFTFEYRATDAIGQTNTSQTSAQGWVIVSVTVTNELPTSGPVSTNASKSVPVTVTLPVGDAEGTTSVSFSNVPNQWSVTSTGSQATITPSSTATGEHTITYTVTDLAGQTSSSTITVTVCTVSISSVVPNPAAVNPDLSLTGILTVAISTNGACSGLVLAFDPLETNGNGPPTVWKTFGNLTQVSIGPTEYTWDRPNANGSNEVRLFVRQGFNGANEATAQLVTRRAS